MLHEADNTESDGESKEFLCGRRHYSGTMMSIVMGTNGAMWVSYPEHLILKGQGTDHPTCVTQLKCEPIITMWMSVTDGIHLNNT